MSGTTPGIGHNNGPSMERGQVWRAYQWRKAQKELMPNTIPLMVVKMRLRRAAELGMDYKAYARIRQATGQDIMGLLFSSNALRIIGDGAKMPEAEARALDAVKSAQKLSLVHLPNRPGPVLQANPVLDATEAAPRFTDSWSDMRVRLETFIRSRRLPGNQVVIIGDAPLESEWMAAAKAAGYLQANEYFGSQAG
ncbi:hypothetical protein [Albibacillus kandeliae]|uniref:hypothetical protein n=1 Tax=Albibacillus kandeliae TaxID=2174228 RepID=UPI000D69F72A|nr:hypothetical protein [Albibacillus kandeliae]